MAGGKGKIHEHPNQTSNGFQKNPQNINKKGRPKKIYSYLKEKGFSKNDINTAFGELAFHSFPELKTIVTDEEQPALFRIVAKQLHAAFQKSDWSRIREIMEHVIGKPYQEVGGKMEHQVGSVVELLQKKREQNDGGGKGGG